MWAARWRRHARRALCGGPDRRPGAARARRGFGRWFAGLCDRPVFATPPTRPWPPAPASRPRRHSPVSTARVDRRAMGVGPLRTVEADGSAPTLLRDVRARYSVLARGIRAAHSPECLRWSRIRSSCSDRSRPLRPRCARARRRLAKRAILTRRRRGGDAGDNGRRRRRVDRAEQARRAAPRPSRRPPMRRRMMRRSPTRDDPGWRRVATDNRRSRRGAPRREVRGAGRRRQLVGRGVVGTAICARVASRRAVRLLVPARHMPAPCQHRSVTIATFGTTQLPTSTPFGTRGWRTQPARLGQVHDDGSIRPSPPS